ncbi:hypothetical protein EDD22DRAFT_212815 [Suillus occidentalis]|nr:hypothetical protein EDD22DRAFT_212815 [Suillus occidentalis]
MTVTKVEETLRKEQPLAMALLEAIATGPQRKRRGKDTQRRIRPVCTHALSSLAFCHSTHAQALPMARGIHEFALSIPYDLFVYNSRIGTSPSYSACSGDSRIIAVPSQTFLNRQELSEALHHGQHYRCTSHSPRARF